MIAIISREDDKSTCDVMDWLLQAGKEVIRINEEDILNQNISSDEMSYTLRIHPQNNKYSISRKSGNKSYKFRYQTKYTMVSPSFAYLCKKITLVTLKINCNERNSIYRNSH